MAIKAYDEGTRGVHVVPLGINYERKDQFRSGVWIRVGDPIDVDSWVDRHDGDSRKAMRTLTTKLADDIRDLIVHLNEPEWEPWLEDLEVLVPAVVDHAEVSAGSLLQRKRIADAINHFLEADREKAEVLAKEITTYREAVNSAGLKIGSPVLEQSGLPAVLRVCSTLLRLMLFSLPAMLGSLWHLIPFIAVRSIASLLDQPGKVTVSTHRLLVGLPLYLSWYAALGWLMSLTFLGGAAGKLLCGMVVDRWSSRFTILVTEVLMILGCFALPSVPVGWPMLFFLPLFGFVLNGTSSVIYIGLAPTFTREQRSRGYALYYTTNFFSVALAPFAFGLVGDSFGLDNIFFSAGLIMAISMPLVVFVHDEDHRTT